MPTGSAALPGGGGKSRRRGKLPPGGCGSGSLRRGQLRRGGGGEEEAPPGFPPATKWARHPEVRLPPRQHRDDNIRNQRENVVLTLANAQSRLGLPVGTEPMAKELDGIIDSSEAEFAKSCITSDGSTSYLEKIITPIYETIAAEASINDGKAAHSAWRNYDDFNEYFWSRSCFELGWPPAESSKFLCKPAKGKRIRPLVEPTNIIVQLHDLNYSWHDLVSKRNKNALTILSLWAPVLAIYLMDIHIWYTLLSALVGGVMGARERLGEKERVKRLHLLLTVKDSSANIPKNLEARRRLQFFTNSLFMDMTAAKPVSEMIPFSVVTPYYKETVLYSMSDLYVENEDGISILFYLQKIYPGIEDGNSAAEYIDIRGYELNEALRVAFIHEEDNGGHGPKEYYSKLVKADVHGKDQMTVLTVYIFLYGRVYLALSGLDYSISQQTKFLGNTALDAALNAQFLVQIGMFTAIPMIMGFILELGLIKAVFSFITMQLQLCSVFFTFSLGTRTHYFGRTILHGDAKYHATGRGFVVRHIKFSENYRLYSRSHFVKALEVALLLIVYIATVEDFDDWTNWLLYKGGVGVKGDHSWESWWDEEQYGIVYKLKVMEHNTSLVLAVTWKRVVKTLGLWDSVREIARLYDAGMGAVIFVPIALFSWFPFVSTFQSRNLFNQAFSRGLEISLILAGNKANKQR
nr:unnamed protein product [Digitaria exilis]